MGANRKNRGKRTGRNESYLSCENVVAKSPGVSIHLKLSYEQKQSTRNNRTERKVVQGSDSQS